MDGSARAFVLALAVIALAAVRAHVSSHDNILRIQLWDDEGLSREPITTVAPTTRSPITTTTTKTSRPKKLRVDVNSLYDAMLQEAHPGGFSRFTRHKVRHKRRRPRQAGTDLPWRFHSGGRVMNVAVFDDDVSWNVIEGGSAPAVNGSAVSDSGPVHKARDVAPPMTLRQPQDEVMSKGKHCSVM